MWQPIDTAPHDGTDILLFVPNLRRKVQIGSYYHNTDLEFGKVVRENKGWHWGQFSTLGKQEAALPTHWQPLPENP